MRRVKIVETPSETYRYTAVDQETGEIPLRLPDRARLIALCAKLGWAVDMESRPSHQAPAPNKQQRATTGHITRRYRLGGASKYTSSRRRRRRELGGAA